MNFVLPKVQIRRWRSWLLIFLSVALVLWIRTIPNSLSSLDDLAEWKVRKQIRTQLLQGLNSNSGKAISNEEISYKIQEWISLNQGEFLKRKKELADTFKAEHRFVAPDGKEFPYLEGYDSYLWIRNARNYLRLGTTCDEIVDGECRDTYGMAPVGTRMIYGRSVHIVAIVGLHKILTFFQPHYPLQASAFLVSVLVGALSVLPAYFIGKRLAGDLGGLFAGLTTALNPVLLSRSIGSDNDVWNVAFPLFIMWLAIEAMGASGWRRQSIYSLLAGIMTGLHAVSWRGWLFAYVVILCGLIAHFLFHAIRYLTHRPAFKLSEKGKVQGAARVAGIYYIAAGLSTRLMIPEETYLSIPWNVLINVWGVGPAIGETKGFLWPDVLSTVEELFHPNLALLASSVGGEVFLIGGLFGLVLLLFPRGNWNWGHVTILTSAALLYSFVFIKGDLSRAIVLGLFFVPIAGAWILGLFEEEEAHGPFESGAAMLIAVWFIASIYVAYGGTRFLLLLGPPFGIAAAVTAGRFYESVSQMMPLRNRWYVPVANTLLFVLVSSILIQPVWIGYQIAERSKPQMTDAWRDTLAEIRAESSSNTIINAWWDYGYWIKYFAERRVSNDGGSLLTHVPHWIGKALTTASEKETEGIFRMLNCGSDATPRPEGRFGAFEKVRSFTQDPLEAYGIISNLVGHNRKEAEAYLSHRGFSALQQKEILFSTHCVPPDSRLILSSKEISTAGSWSRIGLWDPRRIYIKDRSKVLSRSEVLGEMVSRLGYSQKEAEKLYTQTKALTSREDEISFISPIWRYYSRTWISCQADDIPNKMICPTATISFPNGSIIEKFIYNKISPSESRLIIRLPHEQDSSVTRFMDIPAVIILAGLNSMEVIPPSPSEKSSVGVLVDISKDRVLFGSPELLSSTFTHLFFLDGRYSNRFKKSNEKKAYTGERIVTWEMDLKKTYYR